VILGRDVSGVVEAAGPPGFAPGIALHAMLGIDRGSYAEYVLVRPEEAAPKPRTLDHVPAAGVPLAGLTAWQGLFDHGGLRAGQRVLIHGGAGGVGHFAVQFAKAKGATVFATASGDHVARVRELGADTVIDYRTQRFEAIAKDIDVVLDLVAGEVQERSWAVLKPGGIIVSALAPPSPEKAAAHRARGVHFRAHPDARQLSEIDALIEAGQVTVIVQATFALAEVAKAHQLSEQGHTLGKIVLRVAE
jgi:NADPH:quinone reductase-like Zn-dependent oxidoreductase